MGLYLTPDWFKNTYIGIEVEQFIGIGVMVVVAGVVHLLVSQALRLYVRARLHGDDREFWDQERARLGRATLALIVAITVILGFPTLGFESSVENVVNRSRPVRGGGPGGAGVSRRRCADVLERRAEQTGALRPTARTTG